MHEFQDGGQGLRGVEGGVVEQNDATRLQLLRDPLIDGFGIVIFPVQTVHIPLDRFHTNGANS